MACDGIHRGGAHQGFIHILIEQPRQMCNSLLDPFEVTETMISTSTREEVKGSKIRRRFKSGEVSRKGTLLSYCLKN